MIRVLVPSRRSTKDAALPRPLTPGIRPSCPDGHVGGRILLAGQRRRANGLYARPIYRCFPAGGPGWDPLKSNRAFHRFTAPHEHTTAAHPDGEACAECQVQPERHQGPLVPHGWDFAARQVAETLLLVGRGLSYRKTGQQIRLNARRYRTDIDGLAVPSKQGGTTHRYLDAFAPAVLDAVEHRTWPRILLLDALPVRARVVDLDGRKLMGGEANGAFLFACGYTEPVPRPTRASTGRRYPDQRYPHLWSVRLSGGTDATSWWDFLDRLEGMPEWVVTDGDEAIKNAVRDKWPDGPVIYSCEGHLIRGFERAAIKDGWSPNDAHRVMGSAFHDETTWREFVARLAALPPENIKQIAGWVGRHHTTIVTQMALRRPGYPRAISAAEASIEQIDTWIGDRRKVFQNVRRTNLTLGLMRAQIAGHADSTLYSRVIRRELEAVNARPDIDWTKHHDKFGRRGLYALAEAASQRRPIVELAANRESSNRSIENKILIVDAYRESLGFPPLVVSRTGVTVTVSVAGQTLADRPEILREWDRERNGDIQPETVRASSVAKPHWRCVVDPTHRWQSSVRSRCATLAGCPPCGNRTKGPGTKVKLSDILDLPPIQLLTDAAELAWDGPSESTWPEAERITPVLTPDQLTEVGF